MSTNKIRINNATLKTLKAKDRDWYIRDSMQTGFQIKTPPSGNSIYQVEARLGGTGRVKKFKIGNVLDTPLTEAREKARTALAKIRSGTDPLQEKRSQTHEGKTLKELIETYIRTKDLKPRTIKDYRYAADKRLQNWIDKRVTDITKHEVFDWYTQGNKTPTQTDQAFRFMNALMNFAIGLEIITENPCHLVTSARIRKRINIRTSHIELNHDIGKFFIALTKYNFTCSPSGLMRPFKGLA